jgi:hypothetical protein
MKKRMKVIFFWKSWEIVMKLLWAASPLRERGEPLTTNPNYRRSKGIQQIENSKNIKNGLFLFRFT